MQTFWKAALAVGGLCSVGAFVLWSLYKQWLTLPIFSRLSPQQTFTLMVIFLILTFIAFVLCFAGYIYSKRTTGGSVPNNSHIFDLHKNWEGVNEVDSEKLVGPDVVSAARALTITARAWLDDLVDKDTIIASHFDDFEILILAMRDCEKVVPGFEKKGMKCKDFITDDMRKVYSQMKQHKK